MKFTNFADQSAEAVQKDFPEENVIAGAPKQTVWNHFVGAGETVKSGMWDCTAGVFKGPMNDQIEFCHILEGEARIETADGGVFNVKAGDAFVMDNGLQPIWHVETYIRKHYVIVAV